MANKPASAVIQPTGRSSASEPISWPFMISDVLFQAEQKIDDYLSKTTGVYEGWVREEIVQLRAEMRRVRRLPGLDAPPED
jgi:hypothetical protein